MIIERQNCIILLKSYFILIKQNDNLKSLSFLWLKPSMCFRFLVLAWLGLSFILFQNYMINLRSSSVELLEIMISCHDDGRFAIAE